MHWLRDAPTSSYLGDTFRLTYIENHGAFLGMGSNWPDEVRFLAFVVVSALLVFAALGVVVQRLVARAEAGDGKQRLWMDLSVLGPLLVVSGGIGNLIDRAQRDGAVVDFMNLGVGSLRTGIFNVADVAIMAGLFAWLLAARAKPAASTA
jgi:signal peptidase II